MAQTLEERIETRGPDILAALVPQFKSLHLISKIQAARLKQKELRNEWFYGGDGAAYGVKDNEVFLYLTNFANNPLAKDPQSASHELTKNHNFFVDKSTASGLEKKASSSNGVLAFALSGLLIQKENDEWGYIEVSTSKLAEGKDAFRAQYGNEVAALFNRVHGNAIYGPNGIGDLLSKKGEDTTRIYMLNKEYVQKVLGGKEAGAMVARACFLNTFSSHSDAFLVDRAADYLRCARGVVKSDKQKIMPYEAALNEARKIAPDGTLLNSAFVRLVNTIYGK